MKVTASWRNDLHCFRYSIHDEEFVSIVGKRVRGNCPKSLRSKKAAIQLGEQRRAELIAQHQLQSQPATRKRLPDGRVVPLASDLFSLFVTDFYVEVMGKSRYAGRVQEADIFGCKMVRVDIPHADATGFAQTKFFHANSLFCITPVSEEVARAIASHSSPPPVYQWEFPARQLAPAVDAEYEEEHEF